MFLGHGASNIETLVRSVVAHGFDGSSFELMPHVNIPTSNKALGLLGSLALKSLRLRDFCRVNGAWKYLILILSE